MRRLPTWVKRRLENNGWTVKENRIIRADVTIYYNDYELLRRHTALKLRHTSHLFVVSTATVSID
jgi:hypothetical protein